MEAARAPSVTDSVVVWVGVRVAVTKLVTLKVAVTLGSEGVIVNVNMQLLPALTLLPPVPITNEHSVETFVATPAVTFVVVGESVNELNVFAAKAM